MKYIRTKDGKIYKVEKEYKNEIVVASSKTGNSNLSFHKSFVSAQADTIEELCDAFVYAKCDYMELEEAKREKELNETDWQQDGLPIYGAIWTDKGLIYVAKMNDKGEFELL